MAKNVILMIGDGMGWEMTRASAIQAEIEQEIAEIREENPHITNEEIASRFDGRSLDDYYTKDKGSGTSYQNLEGYAIATTGNTYIAGDKNNSALQTNPNVKADVFNHNTGQAALRKGFKFNPNAAVVKGFEANLKNLAPTSGVKALDNSFNEAPILDRNGEIVGGNVPIFNLESGGKTPWDDNYYRNRDNTSRKF